MSDTVIRVEYLSKEYKLGLVVHDKLADLISAGAEKVTDGIRKLLNIPKPDDKIQNIKKDMPEYIWAIKDISFEVKQGEIVGIIGKNGAGKSTLLKILTGITEPTEGRVWMKGRVGSLLEVGTGFHPELTGRENVFLNGAILGMARTEIKKKFDEIVAFAEIEKFIDTPVKRYSSGMYVRLAFAVAAHLEPEILMVDEVLAVGDASFQKKCLGKMGDVSKQGRTILFVSHNMTALQSLCQRAIWLNDGHIKDDGQATKIVANYLQAFSVSVLEQKWDNPEDAPGTDKVRVHYIRVSPEDESTDRITIHTPIKIEFEFWNFVPNTCLNISLHLYNLENIFVFDSPSESKTFQTGLVRGVCHIPGNLLNDGGYRVEIMVLKDTSEWLFFHDNLAMFEIHDVERDEIKWYGKWAGIIRPKLIWKTEWLDNLPNIT